MADYFCNDKTTRRIISGLTATGINQELIGKPKNKKRYLTNPTVLVISGQGDFTASMLSKTSSSHPKVFKYITDSIDTAVVAFAMDTIVFGKGDIYDAFIKGAYLELVDMGVDAVFEKLC